MRTRGPIGLDDLLRALRILGIADEATAAVGRCLGLRHTDPNPPERRRGAYDLPPRRKGNVPIQEPAPPLGAPAVSEPAPPPDLPKSAIEAVLTTLDPAVPTTERPDWLNAPTDEPPSTATARRAPLLPYRTATAVLSAAVATRRPGSDLDVQRLIAGLVRGDRMRELPRLPVANLDRGIQLLLDANEAMTPFREDLGDLADAFERVVGHSRCRIFEFTGNPVTATGWDKAGIERPWKPEPGRPVVLATEFGIGAPLMARDRVRESVWLDFAQRMRKARCPLIAFVPLPPTSWPMRLSRQITLIHWDPRTTAGAVRRFVGTGHEIPK